MLSSKASVHSKKPMKNNSQTESNGDTQAPALPPHDPGYFYDSRIEAGQHGEIRLSPVIQAACKCGGLLPYQTMGPDGEPIWCVCRSYRMRMSQIDRLISNAQIPVPFRYKFLDDFDEMSGGQPVPDIVRLKGMLSSTADSIMAGNAPKGFFLWGSPGTGKTFFSYIALNYLMFRTHRAGRFASISSQFYQRIRDTFNEESVKHGQASTLIEALSNVPYLVLDDVGVQRNTDWELEMLYNLIDARYANKRLTIITSNESAHDIKNLASGRLYSRFVEMCHLVRLNSEDYRERGKSEVEIKIPTIDKPPGRPYGTR
jgi:DNA replication protein DnaC